MNHRLDAFVAYVNGLAAERGLPDAYLIGDDEDDALTLSAFRRTLAWHLNNRHDGELVLANQYKHAGTSIGRDGYASTANHSLRRVMDEEAADAHARTLKAVGDALLKGVRVSGPAGQRLVEAAELAQPLLATFTSRAQVQQLLNTPGLQVFDNPDAFGLCVYDLSLARCAGTEAEPDRGSCQADCANHARTDDQIDELREHETQHRTEAESPLTPEPLAVRLMQRAEDERDRIERHERSGVFIRLETIGLRSSDGEDA